MFISIHIEHSFIFIPYNKFQDTRYKIHFNITFKHLAQLEMNLYRVKLYVALRDTLFF